MNKNNKDTVLKSTYIVLLKFSMKSYTFLKKEGTYEKSNII